MKKWKATVFLLSLAVAAALSLTACTGGVTKKKPQTLAAPTVTISATGLASWEKVPNASGYRFRKNGGAEQKPEGLSVRLSDGDRIAVKAVGDGKNYLDSGFSTEKTYDDRRIWDGTTPETAPAGFIDKGDGTFSVTDADAFAWFAATVTRGETYAGKTVELADDVDLNGCEWSPIGGVASRDDWTDDKRSEVFNGTFDGKSHSISGLKITTAPHEEQGKDSYYGLFGASFNAVFKNIDFVGVSIASADGSPQGDSVAPLVGYAMGSLRVENCSTDATSAIEGKDAVSALAGRCYGTETRIENCVSEARLKSLKKAGSASGIIANGTTQEVAGCVNKGSIEGGATLGGILGMMSGKFGVLRDCVNRGSVTGSAEQGSATGGIVGSAQTATILNCVNYGTIVAEKGNAAGIAANYNNVSNEAPYRVEACANYGDVSAKAADGTAGGIMGCSYAPVLRCQNGYAPEERKAGAKQTVISAGWECAGISHTQYRDLKDCVNYADVSGGCGAAGAAYYFTRDLNSGSKCENTVNYGGVSAKTGKRNEFVGGVFGYVSGGSTGSGIVNNGTISAPATVGVGGIVGLLHSADPEGYAGWVNNGAVTGRSLVGGIVGYHNSGDATYSRCVNNGAVTAAKGGATNWHGEAGSGTVFTTERSVAEVSAAGGLIGFARAGNIVADGCAVTASVAGAGNYVAGIVGVCTRKFTVKNCAIGVAVTGADYVGGLVGAVNGQSFYETENASFTGARVAAGENTSDGLAGTLY